MPLYSTYCCDANLVVALNDAGSADYLEIVALWERWVKESATIIAPPLLRYEVVNAVHRMVRAGYVTSSWATQIVQSLETLPIQIRDYPGIHLDAFQIAQDLGLPASYDSHYLALARREGVDFYTLDHRLVNTVKDRLDFIRYAVKS